MVKRRLGFNLTLPLTKNGNSKYAKTASACITCIGRHGDLYRLFVIIIIIVVMIISINFSLKFVFYNEV